MRFAKSQSEFARIAEEIIAEFNATVGMPVNEGSEPFYRGRPFTNLGTTTTPTFFPETFERSGLTVTSPRIGLFCLREHPRAAGWGCGWS